jgi:hypothetical protein
VTSVQPTSAKRTVWQLGESVVGAASAPETLANSVTIPPTQRRHRSREFAEEDLGLTVRPSRRHD